MGTARGQGLHDEAALDGPAQEVRRIGRAPTRKRHPRQRARRGRDERLAMHEPAVPSVHVAARDARDRALALRNKRHEHGGHLVAREVRRGRLGRAGEERLAGRKVRVHGQRGGARRRVWGFRPSARFFRANPRCRVMRRGQERFAPVEGYDVGPLARDRYAGLVIRKAGLFPGDWALDVQTGTGILGVNLARAFTRVKTVVTDVNRDNLVHARENAVAERCDERLRYVLCLPDMMPFKDETFYFTTVGFRLCAEEEPLDTLDEIHRVTGFYGKVYAPTIDFRKMRGKKPDDIIDWVFTSERIAEMREMGYGKVQTTRIMSLPDGAVIQLVMTKRLDPEGGEDDEGDEPPAPEE